MNVEVMCRIADGPLRPGELEVTQPVAPLVSWSVSTRDRPQDGDQLDANVPIELHLPDSTVWTGEAYPVADVEPDDEALAVLPNVLIAGMPVFGPLSLIGLPEPIPEQEVER